MSEERSLEHINRSDLPSAEPGPAAALVWGSTLGSAVKMAQRHLVVQPKPDALTTAQATVLPLLFAAQQDIWNPQVLRPDGLPTSNFARYRLALPGGAVLLDIWAVGEALHRAPAQDRLPEGSLWGLRTNGSDWQLIDFSTGAPERFELSLFDDIFPAFIDMLFSGTRAHSPEQRLRSTRALLQTKRVEQKLEKLIARRGAGEVRRVLADDPDALRRLLVAEGLLDEADDLSLADSAIQDAIQRHLHATQLGFVRAAPPLAHVSAQDVMRHSEAIQHLKGQLVVTFDQQPVDIRSRSGFLHVLCALALQYGREDLIPADLLTRPPDIPPSGVRARELGRPGWYLSAPNDLAVLEEIVRELLANLNLQRRFEASQRGQPYPSE
ncbi:MAG TPA: hypothetical protein VF171_06255 [Trueperaceae bacterium]